MRTYRWRDGAAPDRRAAPAPPASHTRATGRRSLPTAADVDAAREEALRPLRQRGEKLLARAADEPRGADATELDAAVEELRWWMAGCPQPLPKGSV